MKRLSLLKKGDFVIFGVLALLIVGSAAFLFFPRSEKKDCIILQDDVIMESIPLDGSVHRVITITGEYVNRIEIDGDRVRFLESDCPNLFCVNTGWISEPYQTAVCLPNRVMIRIESEEEAKVDAVA